MTKTTKLLSAAALSAGMLLASASAEAGRARRRPAPARQTKSAAVTPEGETCTLVSRRNGNGGKGSYTETVCAETGKPPVKPETARR